MIPRAMIPLAGLTSRLLLGGHRMVGRSPTADRLELPQFPHPGSLVTRPTIRGFSQIWASWGIPPGSPASCLRSQVSPVCRCRPSRLSTVRQCAAAASSSFAIGQKKRPVSELHWQGGMLQLRAKFTNTKSGLASNLPLIYITRYMVSIDIYLTMLYQFMTQLSIPLFVHN